MGISYCNVNGNYDNIIQNWLKEDKVDYQYVANKWLEIDNNKVENKIRT